MLGGMAPNTPPPADAAPLPAAAPDSPEAKKLARQLMRLVHRAVEDYSLIAEGDLVMVGVSGGKDSLSLLDLLLRTRRVAKAKFEVVAVNLDMRQPGFPAGVLPAWFERVGVRWHVETRNLWKVVEEKTAPGETLCSLCGRLRRGYLYKTARELGATKVALGHHRDDLLATFLLNLFHAGSLKTMPPKLRSDDGRHVLIRPLAYCPEADLARHAALQGLPVIPCGDCAKEPDLQRAAMGRLLREWDAAHPVRLDRMLTALGKVQPSHLLDRNLFDFSALDEPSP
jgi:tRNA 2-thiocytidine biosynthesis protein TtcA